VFPVEFSMLGKSLVTLEGLVAKLDTELNIMEIAEPIARKLMFKTFSLENSVRKFTAGYWIIAT